MNRLLTAKEVGDRLGIHYATVHLYVKQGKIKPIVLSQGKKRRNIRFDPAEVERFVRRCERDSLRKKVRKILGI